MLPLHPGFDNWYKLVFSFFIIGCFHVSDTQYLITGSRVNRDCQISMANKHGYLQFSFQTRYVQTTNNKG